MGRKPNALIAEFFERGSKLEDSSNRYQHTCKSCGEKFPKGRIDSLTNHIVKNCPAISIADRQKAINTLTERTQQTGASYLMALDLQAPQNANSSQLQSAPENMSALETLAEVSRQQLDTNGQHVVTGQNSKKRKRTIPNKQVSELLQQPHQQLQLQQQMVANDLLMQDAQLHGLDLSGVGGDSGEIVTRALLKALYLSDVDAGDLDSVLRHINQFVAENAEHPIPQASVDVATARMIPDQLALAASAATEIMPKSEAEDDPLQGLPAMAQPSNESFFGFPTVTDEPSIIDPQLQPNGDQMHQADSMQSQIPLNRPMTLQPRPSSVNPNLPHAQYMHDFRLNGDPHKSKTRGRFTDTRRKEVQEVRRQGACIRCRMLKKPCSGGTPCSTCQHVESARLWKSPCMRARIADEFDLYSAGLHNIIAFHEVNKVKPRVTFDRTQYVLEATHFLDSDTAPAILPTVRGTTTPLSDNPLMSGLQNQTRPSIVQVELLNQDIESIPALMDQYIRRASKRMYPLESSPFMRPTLALASELANNKLDPLLNRALELWTGTHMLVDPNMPWHLSSVISKANEDGSSQRIVEDVAATAPLSYRLLTHQLKGHIEKRCAHTGKSLMNDLERRLLQRGHASSGHFETFLTAVILLNCVEKMCWLFNAWDIRISHDNAVLNSADGGMTDSRGNRDTWPLEKPPENYVSKGDLVADVVSMLLRMRSVPPATVIGTDGVIHFDTRASAKLRDAGNQANDEEDGERNTMIAAWFESVALKVEDLMKARDATGWDSLNNKRWELKHVSRLLLPE